MTSWYKHLQPTQVSSFEIYLLSTNGHLITNRGTKGCEIFIEITVHDFFVRWTDILIINVLYILHCKII